jgi:hypothetical protein
MPHINFEDLAQNVEPAQRPPEDYLRIGTTPRMFGEGIAEGEQRFGAGAEAAAAFFGEVRADDQTNKFMDASNNVLYGDPNTPDDRGFFGLQGEAASRAWPGVQKRLNDLRTQYREGLDTPRETFYFDQYTRRYQSYMLNAVGRHAAQQYDVYAAKVEQNQADLAKRNITNAVLSGDQDGVKLATNDLISAYVKTAHRMGMDDPTMIEDAFTRGRADATRESVLALSVHDPMAAEHLLEQRRADLPGDVYAQLSGHLREATFDQQAQNLAFGPGTRPTVAPNAPHIPPPQRGVGGTALVPGGAVSSAGPVPEDLVQRIRRAEGSGDTSVSPAGAIGFMQVLPSTAQPYLRPGENLAEHDVNDRVARAYIRDLHDKYAARGYDGEDLNKITMAAYNAGPQRVDQWLTGQRPLPAETERYIGGSPDGIEVPGLSADIQRMMDSGLDPRVIQKAISLKREVSTADWTDRQRAYELNQRAVKQASDTREAQIVADVMSEKPTITARQAAADQALTPSARIRMVDFIGAQGKAVDARLSRETTTRLFADMHLPAGNPDRIADMGPINEARGKGELTDGDYSWLAKRMDDIRSPGGEKLATTIHDFVTGMKSSITKSNPLMGQLDRTGDRKFYEWQWMINHKVDEYREAGKDPFLLFNPHSPADYLGTDKAMQPYVTSLEQSMGHMTDALGLPSEPTPGGPPAGIAAANPYNPQFPPRKPGESTYEYAQRIHLPVPAPARQPQPTAPAALAPPIIGAEPPQGMPPMPLTMTPLTPSGPAPAAATPPQEQPERPSVLRAPPGTVPGMEEK